MNVPHVLIIVLNVPLVPLDLPKEKKSLARSPLYAPSCGLLGVMLGRVSKGGTGKKYKKRCPREKSAVDAPSAGGGPIFASHKI